MLLSKTSLLLFIPMCQTLCLDYNASYFVVSLISVPVKIHNPNVRTHSYSFKPVMLCKDDVMTEYYQQLQSSVQFDKDSPPSLECDVTRMFSLSMTCCDIWGGRRVCVRRIINLTANKARLRQCSGSTPSGSPVKHINTSLLMDADTSSVVTATTDPSQSCPTIGFKYQNLIFEKFPKLF